VQQYGELWQHSSTERSERGLINIRRLYSRYSTEVWRNNSEILELVRQVNEVTKKEASVIHDMASLPADEQCSSGTTNLCRSRRRNTLYASKLLLVGQRALLSGRRSETKTDLVLNPKTPRVFPTHLRKIDITFVIVLTS